MNLGVQLTPWVSAPELVAVGERLASQLDTIWVQDQMLARNVWVTLAALAQRGCGVGTNVTWPIGRNPIEMASAAATIGELLPEGRRVTIGMGSGGALVGALFDMSNRAAMVEEALVLMRALWDGGEVALDDFPRLGSRLGYVPGAVAKLTIPVVKQPDIVLAGIGPRITDLTARLADGAISASNLPVHSRAAMRSADYDSFTNMGPLVARASTDPTFHLHFGMNLSIADDREMARVHARRQVALIVGNPGMWPVMERIGLDMDSARATKAAFDQGLGIAGASDRVADSLVDALIIAGTAEDVLEPLDSLRQLAFEHGYTDLFFGAPLGPDLPLAADLLADRVIPELWPDRTSR
jgi:alkanesulfonate monooxygenase SsuD/methylene tetrahydromethanopterin reductase-like flavin-dependent oxidoreductase (luciferase family)